MYRIGYWNQERITDIFVKRFNLLIGLTDFTSNTLKSFTDTRLCVSVFIYIILHIDFMLQHSKQI